MLVNPALLGTFLSSLIPISQRRVLIALVEDTEYLSEEPASHYHLTVKSKVPDLGVSDGDLKQWFGKLFVYTLM